MDNPLAPVLADVITELAATRAECHELGAELTSYRELAYVAIGQLADALRANQRLRETGRQQSGLIREFVDAVQDQQVA